jgi:hypothetical protein
MGDDRIVAPRLVEHSGAEQKRSHAAGEEQESQANQYDAVAAIDHETRGARMVRTTTFKWAAASCLLSPPHLWDEYGITSVGCRSGPTSVH